MNQEHGILAKFERGIHHFQEFEKLNYNYLTGISKVTLEADIQASAYRVSTALPAPPLEIATVFGDCLHNFRSSLDYLAQLLVFAGGRIPKDGGGGTSFPIRDVEPAKPVDVNPGLHPTLRAHLDALQPFHAKDPSRHPLTLLNRLDNIDKHRVLVLGAASLSAEVAFVRIGETAGPDARRYPLRLRTDRPDVVVVDRQDLHEQAESSGMWSGGIVLAEGDGAWSDSIWLIGNQIAQHLSVIIPEFLHLARQVAHEVNDTRSAAKGSA